MKKLLISIVIVALFVLAFSLIPKHQASAEVEWDSGYPAPEPPSVCCYDVEDNPAVCDAYYESHPLELCLDCPDKCVKFRVRPVRPIIPIPIIGRGCDS